MSCTVFVKTGEPLSTSAMTYVDDHHHPVSTEQRVPSLRSYSTYFMNHHTRLGHQPSSIRSRFPSASDGIGTIKATRQSRMKIDYRYRSRIGAVSQGVQKCFTQDMHEPGQNHKMRMRVEYDACQTLIISLADNWLFTWTMRFTKACETMNDGRDRRIGWLSTLKSIGMFTIWDHFDYLSLWRNKTRDRIDQGLKIGTWGEDQQKVSSQKSGKIRRARELKCERTRTGDEDGDVEGSLLLGLRFHGYLWSLLRYKRGEWWWENVGSSMSGTVELRLWGFQVLKCGRRGCIIRGS